MMRYAQRRKGGTRDLLEERIWILARLGDMAKSKGCAMVGRGEYERFCLWSCAEGFVRTKRKLMSSSSKGVVVEWRSEIELKLERGEVRTPAGTGLAYGGLGGLAGVVNASEDQDD